MHKRVERVERYTLGRNKIILKGKSIFIVFGF